MKSDFSPKIIFIVGPTGVGKTDIALELAGRIPSEIVSCDSMQIYKEVSIANSKPSASEQKKITHHLLDVVSVEEKFDVATFNKLALAAIDKILAKKKYPIVVGGSGMYVQILLDGIFEEGERDPDVRKALEQQGAAALYKRLKAVDPAAAEKIHANDVRRMVRALEVYETTRIPISKKQQQRSGLWGKYPIRIFGINRDRQELYDRINRRVDGMFADGLLDEVKAIMGLKLSLTAERIIGVREIVAYLRREVSFSDAKELMKMNTRRLAKRQMTWFRHEKRIEWLMLDSKISPQQIVTRIAQDLSL